LIITQISPQKKDPRRENIYLDGDFAFGISAEARFEARLKVGQALTEQEVRKIVFSDQVGKLFISAQKFLSFRPRSEKEIRENLKRKLEKGEYVEPDKILDEVTRKLEKLDLINDVEFTRWWVEQRQKFRPRGERLLRLELHQKGIPREIIDEVFFAYEAPAKEIDRIAQKVLGRYKSLPPLEFRQKLGGYLARRGYDWDEITRVVDRLAPSR
jgi:regulatory protein